MRTMLLLIIVFAGCRTTGRLELETTARDVAGDNPDVCVSVKVTRAI